MQKIQQIPEKGLFTFYKQQQDFQTQHANPQPTQTPSIPPQLPTKKKAKKKIKHHTQSTQKQSPEKQSNFEFQPIKQQTHKKHKPHKKGSKLSKKKLTKQQTPNNSTILPNNSSVSNKKQHFLPIVNSYNSNKKSFLSKQNINSVSMILKPQEKSRILQLHKHISSPQKKTIISEADSAIKPFEKQSVFEEDDYLANEFGSSINLYTKTPQISLQNSEQNQSRLAHKVQSALDNDQHLSIKEKFLSKVIRKNVFTDHSMSPVCQKKTQFQNVRCLTELSQKKNSVFRLFQNKQITESIVQKSEGLITKNIQKNAIDEEKSSSQNRIDKYLRFESKTQQLRKQSRIQKGQLRRFSKVTSVHIPQEKEDNFRCEINSSSFLPAHRSSLAIQEVIRTQNSQIFESYDVYQYYRRLKTKSKKLLRFSMIKSHTTKRIEKNKVSEENSENKDHDDKINNKLAKSTQRQAIKLPLIAHGCGKMEKTITRVLSSQTKSTKSEKNLQKVKISAKNGTSSFEKYKKPNQQKQMKQRLRCYTQEHQTEAAQIDLIKNKILNTIIEIGNCESNMSNHKDQPDESYNKNFIEKSVSTKIIQNFQERHYRKVEQEKEGSKLSTLDMSENFIMNWKESLDWESKKKLIVKKLGIKI